MKLAALDLGELLFVVFFIGLPLVRAVMEARKKKAAERDPSLGRGAPAREVPEADEHAGRDLWERMLRGELPESDAEAATAVEPPAPVLPVPVQPVPSEPYPYPRAPFAPAADEELVAEAHARETAELAHRWGEAALVPMQLAPLDAGGGEPSYRETGTAEMAAAYSSDRRSALASLDLRRAILASEILGLPVSLRRDGVGGSTPPGLAL